ncbi:HNH endonuclease [Lactobacillus kefiranofaciens]|uniref:HNH endonuclease n=1 Tax=Lactobacillus kefiranofaciens TaxID=267818 RepID=UPI00246959A6|nr:HNH endonuclease [Lactobacillus kefiranofaciens]MDH5099762.1 HNH endonuclease [Lactobacillus kefiranofaciens]
MNVKDAQQKVDNYLMLEEKINELKAKQKEINHLLSINNIKYKAHRNGFLQAKKFLINRAKYIKHLNKIHPQIKYISGYKMQAHDGIRNFRVLVQDKKTKIRFYANASDLRKPNYNTNTYTVHRVNVFKDDLKEYDQLIKKHNLLTNPIIFYPCKECGRAFESTWGKQFCSKTCKKRWTNHLREQKRSKRAKLARKNGKYDNSISLEKIYKRDHGICYICGKKLNLDTYYNDPLAPTIEHVIPIIKGGTHTWDNVKLACRECNTAKGSKLSQEYIDKAS